MPHPITPHSEVARLIDAYHGGDCERPDILAFAITNAAAEGRGVAFLRHGLVWTTADGRLVVREPVVLDTTFWPVVLDKD